ncbi:GNAT family N-acetyltransferase [Actinokineospora sp. NBRC 105648]|uniref:GNAT family N-acetyltransferase n=1 Tax=Actinokineospora sp. NBRC 105648 TaxID=3032206 RepID=UPI0024A40FED|nr:GNAT family N-acetyltransferase [Actinokineospora sp. NBRC 105648]GLZ41657.1 putative acetyltransferase [Actinokineospora sp. NBRC 105648]
MTVTRHATAHEFWEQTRGLFSADPIRHTGPITVLNQLVGQALTGQAAAQDDMLFLTAHRGSELVGAVLQTPPHPLAISGLPVEVHDELINHLLANDIRLPGVRGPRDVAELFIQRWTVATGAAVSRIVPERLYRLEALAVPAREGHARIATTEDLPLVGRWCDEFADEVTGEPTEDATSRSANGIEVASAAMANGRPSVIWVDGDDSAFAMVTAPLHGMSRIGPVYTPHGKRRRGYGSAVTAAAARWALDQGARDVLLFADLDNPTANSIYQKIGFRPVLDAVDAEFAERNTLDP